MHTVIETQAYLRDAERIGMSDEDRVAAVNAISIDPSLGDIMEGTGGVRKFRLAGRGKGKSGGYRIVTYFGGEDIPVFMLAALSKGETANLSKAERNELKAIVSGIADDYREGLKLKIASKRRK